MSSDADPTSRRRKRKALLAGGTVLGLGTAVTLAAWTDDVWVSGTFAAGTFNLQGAVDSAGTAWADYDTQGGAGGMSFTVNPSAMTPGDSVYAPLNLRIGPNVAGYDANISLPTVPTGPASSTPAANLNFFNALRLSLYNVPPTNCNAAGTAGAPMTGFNSVPLNTPKSTTMLTLNRNMTPQGICFKVTLLSTATTSVSGGTTGPLTWNFRAESTAS